MELFRLLFRRSLRISLIVLLVGLIFGYGHFMTPRGPDALAKVWLDMGDSLNAPGVPEYMKLKVDDGAVQEVFLNGNTLYYTLNRTNKPVPQLLDYYENLYAPDSDDRAFAPEGAKEALLRQTPRKEREATEHYIETSEEILNDRFIRYEGKGWGGFSTIVTGDEASPEYTARMTERFRSFKETGLASELGNPKIVVAFDDPSQGNTQYFNVWPGSDFDHRNVRPRGNDDAPGYDIEDIERPYGSQRMITFGQNHNGKGYEILVYRSRGPVDDVLAHWATEMSADGWGVSARFLEAQASVEEPEPAMLFVKDGREAYIGLRQAEGDEDVTSTVVVYGQG